MIKEILIALVAVVVVILIIAFAALRFLRADDSDAFDDLPDEPRKPSRAIPDPEPPAPVQRQRSMRPEPARDQQSRALPRTADRPPDERVPAGYRNRDQRSASSDRRVPAAGQRVPVAASRAARPARQADPDAQVTASWEAMSDVDYWTELAADKPLTMAAPTAPTAAAPTAAGPATPAGRRPDAKPDRMPAASRPAARADHSALPVRQRSQGRPPEPATQSIAALARLGGQPPPSGQPSASGQATGPRPVSRPDPSRSEQSRTASRPVRRAPQGPPPVSYPGAQGRMPLPLDDDPLTSPSFPAINASDSRSYRTRRPAEPISQPAQQFPASGYSTPAAPDRAASAPNGYPVQQPAANPYGSFVGTPSTGYANAPTGHLDNSGYGAGYAAPQQPAVPDASWYPTDNGTGNGIAASYYDTTYTSPGQGGSTDASEAGYPGNGYTGADHYDSSYGDSAYPGGYPAPTYPAGYPGGGFQSQPDPASYPPPGPFVGHSEQRAIGAAESAYGHEGYQGYPGYGGNGR